MLRGEGLGVRLDYPRLAIAVLVLGISTFLLWRFVEKRKHAL